MRMKIFTVILIVLSSEVCIAQAEIKTSKVTSIPENSRYEILQSDLFAKLTFKIDKYSGDVYQLVLSSDETLTWQLLLKQSAPNDFRNKDRVNYQLFVSGIAARYTFLINVNTGRTWQLVESKDKVLSFQYVE